MNDIKLKFPKTWMALKELGQNRFIETFDVEVQNGRASHDQFCLFLKQQSRHIKDLEGPSEIADFEWTMAQMNDQRNDQLGDLVNEMQRGIGDPVKDFDHTTLDVAGNGESPRFTLTQPFAYVPLTTALAKKYLNREGLFLIFINRHGEVIEILANPIRARIVDTLTEYGSGTRDEILQLVHEEDSKINSKTLEQELDHLIKLEMVCVIHKKQEPNF